MQIETIKIDKIKPNKWNPNQMTDSQMNFLMAEMKRLGYVQPILVRPIKNHYEIIDGWHRWKAAKSVGYKELQCVIVQLNDDEAKLATINMNRIKGTDDAMKLATLLEELSEKDMLGTVAIDKDEVEALLLLVSEEDYVPSPSKEETIVKKTKTIKCPKCGFEFEVV